MTSGSETSRSEGGGHPPPPHQGVGLRCTRADLGSSGSWRSTLLGELVGTVLEIGPGKGINFAYLPRGIRWIGLEPNPSKHGQLGNAVARHGHSGLVVQGKAERVPLADDSVDAVVGTLVLCSVSDQARVLAEIMRVLRPAGRFVFLEHVASAPGTWSRLAQVIWAPMSRRFQGGCDPSRDTLGVIERAGVRHVSMERFTVPGPLHVEVPHIAGYADA